MEETECLKKKHLLFTVLEAASSRPKRFHSNTSLRGLQIAKPFCELTWSSLCVHTSLVPLQI